MISRLIPIAKQSLALRNYFSTATLDQVNYYNVLGVESGATQQQIHQAYTIRLQNVNPSLDSQTFKEVSEAFVILSNNKSRDAYDSLLKSKRISYLDDAQQIKVSQKSYIAQRREDANRLIRKTLNIDQFGRYKGGLPKFNPGTMYQKRGNAANTPGQFATKIQIETYADRFPEYNIVDSQVAESFKSYHQKDKRDRTMKQPWFTLAVDYDFFTFKTFRQDYLPWIRILAVFGFAVPVLWVFIDKQIKLYQQNQIRTQSSQSSENKSH